MDSWFFDLKKEKLHLTVNGEEKGEVKNIKHSGLGFVKIILITQQILKLALECFDSASSEVCKTMKLPTQTDSRTKFIKQWMKYLSAERETDADSGSSSDNTEGESKETDEPISDLNGSEKWRIPSSVQDTMLKDYFLGTYDVHISNLSSPHPSRATRVVNHDHVGSLTESFQTQSCGQLVILTGMLTEMLDPTCLREPNKSGVEVLGGNHTREALQSLFKMGAVEYPTVKVNVYKPLPRTLALGVGYQHNFILHERKRPMTFLDKVRLMRDCLPEAGETCEWKDMLVIIFRVKDRRCLQQKFTHHLLMAKLSEDVWRKVVQAGEVTEKFYRNMMRISDEVKIENCVDTLLMEGPQAFRIKVKELIDEGFVRSKKAVQKAKEKVVDKETEKQNDERSLVIPEMQLELDEVKEENRQLKEQLRILTEENKLLKKQNETLSQKDTQTETRGTKRDRDTSIEEFDKDEEVLAFWRHETGEEEWLEARILTIFANGKKCKVQYRIDSGVAVISRSWIRKL